MIIIQLIILSGKKKVRFVKIHELMVPKTDYNMQIYFQNRYLKW